MPPPPPPPNETLHMEYTCMCCKSWTIALDSLNSKGTGCSKLDTLDTGRSKLDCVNIVV